MIAAVKTFASHHYVVQDNQIGYKHHESVAFNIEYGYHTTFAYFKEYNNGNITEEKLTEFVGIIIHCGEFSYSEIPKSYYLILGLSGTLSSLSEQEQELISSKEQFNIQRTTITPSVYGESKLIVDPKQKLLVLSNNQEYMLKIRDEIDSHLHGPTGQRAVIVFFRCKSDIDNFMKSQYGEAYLQQYRSELGKVQMMTEETTDIHEIVMRKATKSGNITFATRDFGRGTNFVCRDKGVLGNGGVHCIQTF